LLISWFLARLVMYFTIFGAFDSDFRSLVGLLGLSLALNGGVRTLREKPEGELSARDPGNQSLNRG